MTAPPLSTAHLVSSVRLAAVLTAVGLSREFVRDTLTHWQLREQIDSAELVVSELATNAVKSTASSDVPATEYLIGVQLRLMDVHLCVEVWDRSGGSPVIREQSPDAEGGRGLFLVESLSERWGVYRPAVGGKIVWSELPVGATELGSVDLALRQRALDGLRPGRPGAR